MVWWRYPGSTPKGLILQIPPWAQWSTLIHLKTSLNTAPDNHTTPLTTIGHLPDNSTIFGAQRVFQSFRGVSENCLRIVWGVSGIFEDVWQCLLVSAVVCCCVRVSGVVFGCIWVIFWDAGADWGCIRVYMWAQYGRDQVRTKPTHHFSTTLKGKIVSLDSFEISKYQNLPMQAFLKSLNNALFCIV